MLEKLSLRNYKGWRELDLELGPITLLFGRNSSGKTGILQSLLLLKQTAQGFDPRQHINFGGGERDYADFGSYRDLVYGHEEAKAIGMGLSWRLFELEAKVFLRNLQGKGDSIVSEAENGAVINYDIVWKFEEDIVIDALAYAAVHGDGQNHEEYSIRLERMKEDRYRGDLSDSSRLDKSQGRESSISDSPRSCYMMPSNFFHTGQSGRLGYPLLLFSFKFEKLMERISYLGPLRKYPERHYRWTGERKTTVSRPDGADAIAALVSSERDDESLLNDVAEWLNALNLGEGFVVRATDINERFYEVSVTVGGTESALVDVGFGVSQVLPVIVLLFSAPPGSIVLLEQPELHLHPNAQAGLADLFLHVARQRKIQLIVESHSEHLLRRLQRRIAEEGTGFANPENIKAYFCDAGGEGLECRPVEIDRFGGIANWPENFLGDIGGDLYKVTRAALARRKRELAVE